MTNNQRAFEDFLARELGIDPDLVYRGHLSALQETWNASLDLLFPAIDNLWKETSDPRIGEIREKLISLKTDVDDVGMILRGR